ncbi:uncharacterized protein LOC131288656 [Anopheles ziemanni]|uniref:uncharacterized protein LOC131272062 n=1 Tax=Anopheles coustani TaxID=139045 RepID=UPI002658DEB5|nr:uncharacterized protein LOC131272062 [Anopheles coustani]XP_058173797.1 uncharacterized protein LOC131288656 [Anopheles ziemanni]
MKVSLYMILISILLSKHYVLSHIIRKRQLFREQVLPHAGGKIPDSAFLTDRLALNRLQKDGIAVPDGVLLEQRQYQVFPHQHRTARPTFRVVQTPDNRYISPEGEYSHNTLATVDTTYSIPYSGDKLLHHVPSYVVPKAPNLKELRIPNYAVFNFDYKKKKPYAGGPAGLPRHPLPPLATFNHHPLKLDGPWPHQRLPQDFVSFHAAVGNGLNYPPAAHTPGGATVGDHAAKGGPSGWTSGWIPTTGGASGESFAAQPVGSFEDYYSQLDEKHRFYRNAGEVAATPNGAKGPKRGAILQRGRERGHPQRHHA